MREWIRFICIILCILFGEALFLVGMQYFLMIKSSKWEEARNREKNNSNQIISDMKCFPVPLTYRDEIFYQDTYGVARGDRGHEGCDIMDNKNTAGRIPIVSVSDGTVTNIGWLYLGGYRIGITSEHGIYYYYAHLDSYAAGMTIGKTVTAGELLGFMGSTGEGEEGTEDKFPVHLHFGIYIQNQDGNEETVNSYPYLRKIDKE